jgi:hypothetical protein
MRSVFSSFPSRLLAAAGLLLIPAVAQPQPVLQKRPEVAIIDFYGVRKVPVEKLRKALGVSEGSPMPPSRVELEVRLNLVSGVVAAEAQAVCCEAGKAILYVGIEERGAPHFSYRAEPDGEAKVPEEVEKAYMAFIEQVNEAAKADTPQEDLTEGHSLMKFAPAREIQLQFVDMAEKHGAALRTVLHEAGDPVQRAIAVYVLGYAKDKTRIVDDLSYALKDADDTVRNNAVRNLGAIAVKAKLDPDAEIKVPATWFIEMLNSLSWGDRMQAARFLVNLTDSRDQRILAQIKDRAWDSIVEMAKWKQAEHSLPSYILLGRVAGLPEEDLQHAWSTGDRDLMIKRALTPPKKR